MAPRAIRDIQISYVGQVYSGSYQFKDGMILVTSPYGSKSAAHPAQGGAIVARDLLLKIAEEYRR